MKQKNRAHNNFENIRMSHLFYVDKTDFIRQWWEKKDSVTLIIRPRRFGKTLNLNMLECFFSCQYAGREELFEGLSIWKEENYRSLQGAYPVISLSFASVKTGDIHEIKTGIKQVVSDVYSSFRFIMQSDLFEEKDRKYYSSVDDKMDDTTVFIALNRLCLYVEKYYGKKVILLLDEYDTPMQEAWLGGNWEEAVNFFRSFFNATFKTNPHLYRSVITGVTRISKESIFSDLNHLEVVSTTSEKYATCFGFTEDEVFRSLEMAGLGNEKAGVKKWYDGFTFGNYTDIYNPWSITKFLSNRGDYDTYWADTSENGLVSALLQKSSASIKQILEGLLGGKSFETQLDEQIVFDQLGKKENAIWSLLLAAGYLKVERFCRVGRFQKKKYTLRLTNLEVESTFSDIIISWFAQSLTVYNDFVKALLQDDIDSMNDFMNQIAMQSFSSFDLGKSSSLKDAPERFYHGFVLGLIVELDGRFVITSNRESGFGRYDIMLEPVDSSKDYAYIIEFKVFKPLKETSMEETIANALAQIEEKNYSAVLVAKGISAKKIRKYGFAFEGKKCLIGKG